MAKVFIYREEVMAGFFYFPNMSPAAMAATNNLKCTYLNQVIELCLREKTIEPKEVLFSNPSLTSEKIMTYQLTELGQQLTKEFLRTNKAMFKPPECKEIRAAVMMARERCFVEDLETCIVLFENMTNYMNPLPTYELHLAFMVEFKQNHNEKLPVFDKNMKRRLQRPYFHSLLHRLRDFGIIESDHGFQWYIKEIK